MNKKIDIIKEIAYKLSDYKYVLQVMNDPQNKQKMINKMISLFDEKTLSHGLPAICMLYAELSYIFLMRNGILKRMNTYKYYKKIWKIEKYMICPCLAVMQA